MANNDDHSLSAGMTDLLALFAGDLAEVRFGDLDRAALEGAARAATLAAGALADAERACADARAAVAAAQDDLLRRG
jgi:hypothetical protein